MTQSATSLDEELACPICSYSLRGLAEPRCPECGYQFDWDTLRAANKAKHPYLYEHGRGLAIMRMIRTFIHGLRPGKFWATLNAATEIRLRRLALYWIVVAMAAGAGMLVVPCADYVASHVRQTTQTRRNLTAAMATPSGAAQMKQFRSRFPSTQAFLDTYAPLPWSWRFWQPMYGALRWRGHGQSLIYLLYSAAFAMLWPWITLSLLGIFVQSRGRAKIRWAQLVRCVVYSGDVAALCGVAALAFSVFQLDLDRRFQGVSPEAILLLLLTMVAAGRKLSIALGKYLRTPHALAVVGSTQLIALLVVLIVMPDGVTQWVIHVLMLR